MRTRLRSDSSAPRTGADPHYGTAESGHEASPLSTSGKHTLRLGGGIAEKRFQQQPNHQPEDHQPEGRQEQWEDAGRPINAPSRSRIGASHRHTHTHRDRPSNDAPHQGITTAPLRTATTRGTRTAAHRPSRGSGRSAEPTRGAQGPVALTAKHTWPITTLDGRGAGDTIATNIKKPHQYNITSKHRNNTKKNPRNNNKHRRGTQGETEGRTGEAGRRNEGRRMKMKQRGWSGLFVGASSLPHARTGTTSTSKAPPPVRRTPPHLFDAHPAGSAHAHTRPTHRRPPDRTHTGERHRYPPTRRCEAIPEPREPSRPALRNPGFRAPSITTTHQRQAHGTAQ
ncbi:hypothetical protein G1C97_0505 [Bifidobacterium sp. DSM 109959]|uniref:Uncharacterized protein n=1 Tax=Bifidobacterium olomucense TaxID=2675324 RepID=A0A7Y0EY92_9BIFI|nr:hypothetical protein [Bifidobacterium sp. DSM 109959]